MSSAYLSLLKSLLKDLSGKSVNLYIHLECSYAVRCTCYLEVHVTKEVFHSLDIGKDSKSAGSVLIESLDETHSDTADRLLDRNTGIHQCKA